MNLCVLINGTENESKTQKKKHLSTLNEKKAKILDNF